MNLFRLVRIPLSLALDEHAKQYVLAFPRVITSFAAVSHVLPPVLSSLHTSFVCSQSISTLTNLIQKSMHFHNVRSKKEQKEYKEFEQLFSISIHCNQTHRPAIHREHLKQSMIMHLSDSHVRGNIYFTTKE